MLGKFFAFDPARFVLERRTLPLNYVEGVESRKDKSDEKLSNSKVAKINGEFINWRLIAPTACFTSSFPYNR